MTRSEIRLDFKRVRNKHIQKPLPEQAKRKSRGTAFSFNVHEIYSVLDCEKLAIDQLKD